MKRVLFTRWLEPGEGSGQRAHMVDCLAAPPPLSSKAALFLDFDGTLVELAETPDAIRVAPQLPSLLGRLATRLDGRLALISGRAIRDLQRHLPCEGIAISGSHGLELRLRDGSFVPLASPGLLDGARQLALAYAEGQTGLLVEDKPFSIALHYRQVPEREPAVRAFMASLARDTGLQLQGGKMVAELRPHGADKGDALRTLMLGHEFAGSDPLFIGDDETDENAFRAAAELGGGGVLVGPARDTAARWRLGGVDEVIAWLEELAA